MRGRKNAHWLEDGAVLIVHRDSPLDAIARDLCQPYAARSMTVEGLSFDVVGVGTLLADKQCSRILLKRRGQGVMTGGPGGRLEAASVKGSS